MVKPLCTQERVCKRYVERRISYKLELQIHTPFWGEHICRGFHWRKHR